MYRLRAELGNADLIEKTRRRRNRENHRTSTTVGDFINLIVMDDFAYPANATFPTGWFRNILSTEKQAP